LLELRRRDGRLLRIGHRGAAALAPDNTLESLRKALDFGVDLVEFDVLDASGGRLVLAHDRGALTEDAVSLEDALAFFRDEAPSVGVHLDLKCPGHEASIVDALRAAGLVERTVVSSFLGRSLRAVGALEPGIRLGLTYPEDRFGLRRLGPLAAGGVAAMRRALPHRIGRMLEACGATAAMLHFGVASKAAVERCHERGAAVLVWTVDDPERARRLDRMGVDGVITNDPRIFQG
jgi:glycerophosphoryl diester phosphodiesterase